MKTRGVFATVKRPGRYDLYLKVGNAVANEDGTLSVTLDVLPVDGKLLIAKPGCALPKVSQ